ncbi:MAG: DnaB-like helicase C-terminal domain-containing protein [Candidatus Electryonea clarkiae]|nr:DnaB-like helicase C-terminal domain-containing protein [Candidatus Electryonea clarkiae]MDP8287783.1 DnaB-like helicase C-terminal domain-containing protein [Candidatus Electryonea clarkiae]
MPETITQEDEVLSNIEIERSLIASIAIRPASYFDVRGIITEDVFSSLETMQAFNAIENAYEENRELPQLSNWKPVEDHLTAARTLVDLWQKRQLAALPKAINIDLASADKSADNVLNNMQNEINRIQALIRDQHGDRAVSVSNLFPVIMEDVERRRGRGHGLMTGFQNLDDVLGGLQPALHILAGSPGLGKTTFAVQMASKISSDGVPVIFVSFDEVLWRLTLKSFCQAGELTMKKYADGKYNDDEYVELQDVYKKYSEALKNLHFIEGTARFEVPHLESIARQTMRRSKTKQCLIIVDYLQRWAANSKERHEFHHILGQMVSDLREMAFRLNSPTMVISSLSREGYEDPTIQSLADAGELEFSADTALLLKENTFGTERMRRIETSLTPRALRLIVAKNRYGDLGELSYMFNLQVGRIEEKA